MNVWKDWWSAERHRTHECFRGKVLSIIFHSFCCAAEQLFLQPEWSVLWSFLIVWLWVHRAGGATTAPLRQGPSAHHKQGVQGAEAWPSFTPQYASSHKTPPALSLANCVCVCVCTCEFLWDESECWGRTCLLFRYIRLFTKQHENIISFAQRPRHTWLLLCVFHPWFWKEWWKVLYNKQCL